MTYPFVGPVTVPAPTVDSNPATKLYVDDQIDAALLSAGSAEHTHDAADIITGTLNIGRIPTGSTHDQVSYGDHTHAGFASSTHAATHSIGGTDVVTPAGIGAATASHTHAATVHTHDAADIVSGTLNIARIPTGTTAGTVAAGNDTRLSIKPYPPVAVADAASIIVNAALGNHFRVTVTAARPFGTPLNPTDGQVIIIEITNGTASNINVTFNAAWAAGAEFTTSAITAGKTDLTQWTYRADKSKWWLVGYQKGYS
jgi:hypothetical protein